MKTIDDPENQKVEIWKTVLPPFLVFLTACSLTAILKPYLLKHHPDWFTQQTPAVDNRETVTIQCPVGFVFKELIAYKGSDRIVCEKTN